MWYIVVAFVVIVTSWCIVDRLRHVPWVSGLPRKCVLVTGCSSGFGNAIVKSLNSRGVFVFAGCRTEESAKKLREETGERLQTVMIDVTKTESIEKAFAFVKNNLPPNAVLWGLVNNAGIPGEYGPTEIITREHMHATMDVNCFGMMEMVRVFLPLIKQSKGRIVNMCSMMGLYPMPGLNPYLASKFALTGLSEALRHEKRTWGIKVSTLFPGLFATELVNRITNEDIYNRQWEMMDPSIRKEYGKEYFEQSTSIRTDYMCKHACNNLDPVVEANEHALFAVHPYARYYLGKDAVVMYYLLHWLPDFLLDKVFDVTASSAVPKVLQK